MKPLARVSILVCAAFVAAPVSATVDEAWLGVQEVLSAPEDRALDEPVDDLVRAAEEIDVRRLTPQASAMVAWSISHPEQGDAAMRTAIRFDSQLPAPHFLLSSRSWQRGAYLESASHYVRGWLAAFRHEVTRRHLVMSLGIWIILGAVAAGTAAMIVMTLYTLSRTTFDALSVGDMIFARANAIVFGAVLVLLPVFAGLGPAWLVVYLFVGGWIYLAPGARGLAVGLCCFLAVVPALLETWQRSLLRVPPVTERVSVMLDERQLNPSALREFLDLKGEFDGDPLFHLILGELLRMHSAVESAKVEFQTAAVESAHDSRPYVFLGNMALEDGNVQLAIQYYDSAIDLDDRTALAYHNLSSAYDLIRRFQQGDAARARARDLAGGRSATLGVRGRDPRVRYPGVTSDDVDEFVVGLTDEGRLQVGYSAASLRSAVQLLSPTSMLFWLGAVMGGALLAARSRWFPAARQCSKCGKVYRLEDEPGESPLYCRQCVSVFLQRDLVPIEQQTAKLAQVRRWDRWVDVCRRAASVLAPGSAMIVGDRVGLGLAVGLASWTALVGLVVWTPRFLETIEPTVPTQPVIAVLAVVLAASWLRSVLGSWRRS